MRSQDVVASAPVNDSVWRWRWVTFGSYVVGLACLALVFLEVEPGWQWPGFWWCFLSSLVGAVVMRVLLALLLRRPEMPSQERSRTRHRRALNPWGWMFGGTVAGALSAMIGTNVIGYVVAVYVASNAAFAPWAYRAATRRWEGQSIPPSTVA